MGKNPFGVTAALFCKDKDGDHERNDAGKGPEYGGSLKGQSEVVTRGVREALHPAMVATCFPELRQRC